MRGDGDTSIVVSRYPTHCLLVGVIRRNRIAIVKGQWACCRAQPPPVGYALLTAATPAAANRSQAQPFYRFIRDTYALHIVGMFAALYALGGFPAVVWGGALRACWVYHITWFVNSASHVWGDQTYNTGARLLASWR